MEREKAAASIMAGGSSGFGMTGQAAQTSGPISDVVKEMQSLYAHHGEMGLKEGQTIRCVHLIILFFSRTILFPSISVFTNSKNSHHIT